jgi:hypothetical protein
MLEGNRRAAHAISTMDGDACITCGIVPDNMSQHDIDTFINMKHTVGHEAWSSYVRSKRAYELMNVYNQSIADIVIQCQFSNAKEAQKYIGAYIWFMEYINLTNQKIEDCTKDWSKFHHAYNPTLANHFGFDFATQKFDAPRKSSRKDVFLPTEMIDEKIVEINNEIPQAHRILNFEKTDFSWFCQLVKFNNLSDCRHSDNLVVPIINLAYSNDPKVWPVFKMLMTSRLKTIESPSTVAHRKLADSRVTDNKSFKLSEALHEEVKDILKNGVKLKNFKTHEDYEITVMTLNLLKHNIEKLFFEVDFSVQQKAI